MLLFEGRAALEAASIPLWWPQLDSQQQGDGHPVLVFPGFLASSRSTAPLRWYIRHLGYSAHRWRMGRNYGYDELLHTAMDDRLKGLADREGRKVSLIGWSLGGVYARELARANPGIVRQVITLGSPFRGGPRSSNVRKLYQWVTGTSEDEVSQEFLRRLEPPPPVPTTSIYTLSDAVVAWRASIERLEHDQVENIGVLAAHLGLGVNPLSWLAIADRLAQPEDAWKPFEPDVGRHFFTGIQNVHYPDPPRGFGKTFSPAT